MELDGNKRVFHRLRGGGASFVPDQTKQQKVCFHWRAGRCTRDPCPYLHHELPGSQPVNGSSAGGPKRFADDTLQFQRRGATKFSGGSNTWGRAHGGNSVIKKAEKVCNYWMQGNCTFGDKCRFLHSWSMGDCFSMLTTLEGHQKAVTGIAFPTGSSQLYSGSKDGTVWIWDCQSGQCTGVSSVGGEVGCMLSEGPWLFVGVPNQIKVQNTQDNAEFTLTGPVGQVYAMGVGNGLLFAGIQDGSILAWKFNPAAKCFEPAASLPGHTFPVVSLIVGANRLYSGSMDNTIRVWNLESLQCMQILTDHTSVVMSVLCWDQFLLSCSLDKTIKVWVANDSGNLEVTYTHNEEHGLLSLRGMHDPEGRPVLLCSCNDNCLRVFDLPSFSERGKIFAKQEIRAIEMGPAGLFFTGDGTGQVRVWKWLESPVQQQ